MCKCGDAVEEGKKKPDKKCDKLKEECPLARLTVIVLNELDGKAIENASVEVVGIGSKPTKRDGKEINAVFEKVNPGTYKVKARKDSHIPDYAETEVKLPAKGDEKVTLKLKLLELHMHLDADRDGTVNPDWKDNNTWEPGKGKKGAIIFCNNDDEDSDKKEDNKNDKVDTATDLADIAPLILRKKPKGVAFPPGWKAKLEVSDEQKIRIFDKRADGGKEKIGKDSGKKDWEIIDLKPDEHKLGMEATTYPVEGFDGFITIKLTLFDDKGKSVHKEEAKVRVAPWLMFNHAYEAKKVYVVETSDNVDFRKELKRELPGGVAFEEADKATYGSDRWMQDAMEPGFASMPNSSADKEKWNVPATLRTANNRSAPALNWGNIDEYPKDKLLGPGYGFVEAMKQIIGDSLDSFGNLECSPPFNHSTKKRNYKFGRIVYGMDSTDPSRNMRKKVREFLKAQKVQDPIELDTGWLDVGHVDEMLSFLPLPGNKFKVLLASPKVAMDIVNTAKGASKLLQGIDLSGATRLEIDSKYTLQDVSSIKGDAVFKTLQSTVQTEIDKTQAILKKELDLEDKDFIKLPVLFMEARGRHVAYTPGVVNMLVVTKSGGGVKLCIPKPFGPIDSGKCLFEEDIKTKLKKEGLTYKTHFEFIDDFTTYHMSSGEIHCGTNSQRKPPEDHWWWELDWI